MDDQKLEKTENGLPASGAISSETENVKTEGTQSEIDRKMKEMEERWKNEISSRDKKINEYQKTLREKELEGKTEKEKAELLQREKEQELQKKELELEIAQSNFLKSKFVAEEKLDPEVIELITGRTETEIKASVDKIKAIISKAEQLGVEKALKNSNTQPQKSSGQPIGNISQLQSALAEAKKRGDITTALRIQREIEAQKNKK